MNVDRSLTGKNAFITGSTSGIGLAVAEQLASAGCNIGLNGFATSEQVQEISSRFQSEYEVEVAYCGFDLREVGEINEGLTNFGKEFGQVNILVNNAGVQFVSRVEDFPTEKWDEVIAVNLSAVFHCSKVVIPGMIASQWGRIINIASVHGLVGSVNKSAYIAAKHGVVGLTKVIALENAKSGITCNAICPGYVDTEIIRNQIRDRSVSENKSADQVVYEMLHDKHPTEQFIEPSEIGALATYLCSDQASGINGSTLSIDGGWSAH